jgi:hypothetical protein
MLIGCAGFNTALLFGATLGSGMPAVVFAGGVQTLQPVEVADSAENLIGSADSRTKGSVTAKRLEKRPLLRTGELLETVPGLWISQHSGESKAKPFYFEHGFLESRISVCSDPAWLGLMQGGAGGGYFTKQLAKKSCNCFRSFGSCL